MAEGKPKLVVESLLAIASFLGLVGLLCYNGVQLKSQQIEFSLPLSPEVTEIRYPKKDNTSNVEALHRLSRALQYPTISHRKEEDYNGTGITEELCLDL